MAVPQVLEISVCLMLLLSSINLLDRKYIAFPAVVEMRFVKKCLFILKRRRL